MSKPLRIGFIVVIVALATGWAGLRAQNAALERASSAPVRAP